MSVTVSVPVLPWAIESVAGCRLVRVGAGITVKLAALVAVPARVCTVRDPAWAVGEEPVHQAALEGPGRCNHILLSGNGVVDGGEDGGDPPLFVQGREGERHIVNIISIQCGYTDPS